MDPKALPAKSCTYYKSTRSIHLNSFPLLTLIIISTTATLITNSPSSEASKCIYRTTKCGTTTDPYGESIPVPCVNDEPPKPIENRSLLQQLDEVCPSLDVFSNYDKGLCCDTDQIENFVNSMNRVKSILGRCSSCFINFAQLFCDLTCNPDQNSFAKVTKSQPYGDGRQKAVLSIHYNISNSFVEGLYASCKDVIYPAMNQPAIELMCGDPQCNPKKLVESLGSEDKSPFKIDYSYLDQEKTKAVPCSSSVGDIYGRLKKKYPFRCGYSDCPDEDHDKSQPEPPVVIQTLLEYMLATLLFIIVAALISIASDNSFDHKKIDVYLRKFFTRWALFCTQYSTLVILLGFAFVALSCVGLRDLKENIITDPVKLWSQDSSQAHQEKVYFENNFQPFFRIEQVIVYPARYNEPHSVTVDNKTFSYVFLPDFLRSVSKLQSAIMNLTVNNENVSFNLTHICHAPLGNNLCAIQSPLDWFPPHYFETYENEEGYDYLNHFNYCFNNKVAIIDPGYHNFSCMGPYGGPIDSQVALAGYPGHSFSEANSLVITIPVKNPLNATAEAKAWEEKFLNLLSNYPDPDITISFYSERSIEDEIDRQSQSDIFTIAISYWVMFAYVAISLGRARSLKTFLLESRIVLGLGGVMIVLASVLASIGLLNSLGVEATLIIIEVIPFLVLAVGVDNIFIMVKALQRSSSMQNLLTMSVEERISHVVGEVGPSLLLASLSESACFLIGTLTPMPAVRVFALTASLALFVDFILQMTVFVALLTLDTKRQSSGRYDLFCCLVASKSSRTSLIGSPEIEARANVTSDLPTTPMTNPSCDEHTSSDAIDAKFIHPSSHNQDHLYHLFENYVAPTLMINWVRIGTMIVFVCWLCVSMAVIPKIDIGLDQAMSVPDDSYLQKYFTSQKEDLRVGPPVYFVLKQGLNFSDQVERNEVDGLLNKNSLINILTDASRADGSYLKTPPNSWITSYQKWVENDKCCMMSPDRHDFCPEKERAHSNCISCDLYDPETFFKFIPNFLEDFPRKDCESEGAAYTELVKVSKNNTGLINSAFLVYHAPLRDSKDFILAMKSARSLSSTIEYYINQDIRNQSTNNKLEVFPYCFTYVFYEQYLTIWQQAIRNLMISILTIFVVSYLLLGCDLYIALVIVGTITSILIDLMGLMYFWDIQMNAISLVNLVMAVGISVEFCSHVARSFALSQKTKSVERAQDALINMGSSVLSGITLTKIAGISILALAKSKIFKVYYFRMYMGIVLVGAIHGMIFMPIILSLTAKDKEPRSSPPESTIAPNPIEE